MTNDITSKVDDKKENLIKELNSLKDEELLSVLEGVFEKGRPNHSQQVIRGRFFLGVSRYLSDKDVWETLAVAYINREEYPEGNGPDYGFAQFGTCQKCHTKVLSNVKSGICPVCSSKVFLT